MGWVTLEAAGEPEVDGSFNGALCCWNDPDEAESIPAEWRDAVMKDASVTGPEKIKILDTFSLLSLRRCLLLFLQVACGRDSCYQ